MKTQSGLTSIYNEKVVSATTVTRPLEGLTKERGILHHEGVKLKTDKGNEYLVHKGDGFGKSSQTVVVDAKHMSGKWTERQTVEVGGKTNVASFVKEGGKNYNVFTDNCQDAAKRGMKMAKERGGH